MFSQFQGNDDMRSESMKDLKNRAAETHLSKVKSYADGGSTEPVGLGGPALGDMIFARRFGGPELGKLLADPKAKADFDAAYPPVAPPVQPPSRKAKDAD